MQVEYLVVAYLIIPIWIIQVGQKLCGAKIRWLILIQLKLTKKKKFP
nr:MAG TPA: hypothetical protein [Siphoviridae sp. ctcBx5]